MTIEQKISMALAYKGMSQAALAREIGTSPANLNQRMKRGSFTAEELENTITYLNYKHQLSIITVWCVFKTTSFQLINQHV